VTLLPWGIRENGITIDPHPELLGKTTKILELSNIFEEHTKGLFSKNTTDNVIKVVKLLVSELGISDIKEINYDLLNKRKNTMLDRGLVPVTINSYMSCINSFLLYFGLKIQVPRVKNRLGREAKIGKSLWTAEDFERVLEVIPSPKYRAAVALPYYIGIRAGKNSGKLGYPRIGLLGLNWRDINFEEGTITIIGKRGKAYVRPLPKIAEKYLRDLKETGNIGLTGPDDPVFVSNLGTRLCYDSLYRMLQIYCERARIPKEKRHLHALRHTRGTIETKKRGIRFAQGVLCQDNINSTILYEHINDEAYLKEVIRPDKAPEEKKEVEMKKCPSCSAEITPDRKLCDCGYDFTQHRCPKCGKSTEKNAKFCTNCGVRIGIPTPECVCGQELRYDFNICPNCGRKTDAIKALWDEKSLKEWSRFSTNSNVKPSEMSLPNGSPNSFLQNASCSDVNKASCVTNNHQGNGNSKRYDAKIVSIEQLVETIEEGWEIADKISPEKFVVRRKRADVDNSYEND